MEQQSVNETTIQAGQNAQPAQAAETSKAGQEAPILSAMAQASAGMRWSPLVVEQMMRSSSSGATPAASRAASDASTERSSRVSVVQMRRLEMPVRWEIHSSDVSRNSERSSFVTERDGSAEPVPRMRNPTSPPSVVVNVSTSHR